MILQNETSSLIGHGAHCMLNIQDLAGRLESLLQPQTSPSAPAQAAGSQQAGVSAAGSDGHIRVTLAVDEQGHVQLSLHAEPASAHAAEAEHIPPAAATSKSESKGMKPESAQGKQCGSAKLESALSMMLHTYNAAPFDCACLMLL